MIPFNPFSALTSKIYGGFAVAALLGCAVQTARIEGFLFVDGFKDKLAARDGKIADMRRASDEAWDAMRKLNAETEAHYAKLAKEADRDHAQSLETASAAADRYIAAHRVRKADFCRSSPASAAQSADPGVPADLPAGTVLVSERDVQACTGATAYAIDAHNAAVKQIEAGLAE